MPSTTFLHFFVMAVANPKPSSIKQARRNSLPDVHVSLDYSSDTKNCSKCHKLIEEDTKAICCEFCVTWYHTKCENISDEILLFLMQG